MQGVDRVWCVLVCTRVTILEVVKEIEIATSSSGPLAVPPNSKTVLCQKFDQTGRSSNGRLGARFTRAWHLGDCEITLVVCVKQSLALDADEIQSRDLTRTTLTTIREGGAGQRRRATPACHGQTREGGYDEAGSGGQPPPCPPLPSVDGR